MPPRMHALQVSAVLCTRKGAASLAWLATAACAGLVLAKDAMMMNVRSSGLPMGRIRQHIIASSLGARGV